MILDKKSLLSRVTLFVMVALMFSCSHNHDNDKGYIRPFAGNPFYWQYKGKPVLLLGGTWQDNLFNHPVGLEDHLDKLAGSGGNYVRNTMSHRNEGNVFAYAKSDGKFDLDQWNDEYWHRFDNFLRMTYERDIIVQIEIFDPWDHMADHQTLGGWSKHPFNPANNVNYSAEESGLRTNIGYNPGTSPSDHPFYKTVPSLDNNQIVLSYQQAYVDKLLSISLNYPNVLYCMQNESGEELAFGDYWTRYIREKAHQANREIHTTDMRRNNNIIANDHAFLYRNPNLYTFVDISQNNSQNIATGQLQWDRIQEVRNILKENGIRPMNNTKIYSREDGEHINGPQRFWRVIMGGCASARFHRPHPLEGGQENHYKRSHDGLGLHPQAQKNIASARKFSDAINIFSCEPRNDLLDERSENEAYCLAEQGKQYGIYFPDEGSVALDLTGAEGKWRLRWLDIAESVWLDQDLVLQGGKKVRINTPGIGHCVAVILPNNRIGA